MFQPRSRLKDNLVHIDESVRAAPNISRLISALRRQARLITAFCLAGVAFGTLYFMIAKPLYTASAKIIIDNRQVRAVHDVSTLAERPILDNAEVESQVEVLRSEKVGLTVVKHLNLTEDPAFVNPTWMDKIGAILDDLGPTTGSGPPVKDADPGLNGQLKALKTLNRHLLIGRVGRTLILQIDYTSPDPVRAAEIANAYTDAYLLEQLNSRIDAARHARSWLQQQTEELRELSVNADFAAQKFKADNKLFATKGMLISEQQFSEMTTQLVAAQAATAQAQARYLGIKNIIDTHQTESAVTESLANPVINDLRTKYLDASKRKSDLERKLGPTHITVVNLKNTMDELGTLLFQELARVAQSYRSDYEVAAAREKALTDILTRQQSVAAGANDAQVKLRQLEQKAESYKTLYQSYMQHYQEAARQESFPMSDGHVVSAANPPLAPSYPRAPLVLAISLALGALAGAGVGRLREFIMYRVFRTVEQVRDELGVDVLGMLPVLAGASLPRQLPDTMAPILRYAVDDPFSAFAETMRSAKVAADRALQDQSPKIIGVVSLLPKEGKSIVAKNFASLLALQGAKTLLIDADTRNPSLTFAIGCERGQGSQSALSMPPLTELLQYEPGSGLQILPCIYAKDDPRVAGGLSAAMFHALLRSGDQSLEYIVIDLPPIGPVVNARGMAPAIDAFIFVVEWGTTSRDAVRAALAKEHSINEKLLGVILNKVDMKKLKIYQHFGSEGYYQQHYENYYKHAE